MWYISRSYRHKKQNKKTRRNSHKKKETFFVSLSLVSSVWLR